MLNTVDPAPLAAELAACFAKLREGRAVLLVQAAEHEELQAAVQRLEGRAELLQELLAEGGLANVPEAEYIAEPVLALHPEKLTRRVSSVGGERAVRPGDVYPGGAQL